MQQLLFFQGFGMGLWSISLITGSLIFMSPLNPTLFPGISGTINVHHGFGLAQERGIKLGSPAEVLEAVKTSLAEYGTKKVTIVGHSLVFKAVTYGVPRAGNKAFADYLDTHANITHINNKSKSTNAQCLDVYTPNVAFGLIEELLAHANQHIGPYGDIFMSGCS
ncbi:hypothetical protein BDZ94DRAFT_1240090 [Collybia nuda]|uniref:Fungal lipase-like domain-containing protein n=1 Tax=Collybia nuda TaxID=64659 RepID=A0A9P5XWW1_9AGAR|nr:hypothetical protein BDZ94DRAFT_1240090 [Collybia nuda]